MTTEKHNEQVAAGTEPVIEFDAQAIPPLALIMPRDDIRYYLNGILVRPAGKEPGVIIAATDGHRLAMWHDTTGIIDKERIFHVSPGAVLAAKKKIRASSARRVHIKEGRLVIIDNAEGELFIQPKTAEIEGKYPDVLRVVPPADKMVAGLRGTMNAKYLKTLGEISNLLHKDPLGYSPAPHHYSHGEDGSGSIITRFFGHDNLIVITMPMRESGYPLQNPIQSVFIAKAEAEAALC